ncbi:TetR/AcrR family transcriptional regulator [Opitutaceae bacterium EW11]|nr:TetR/AcrR family transcriptional regulator [Opitutaceae bacterium EW11]
MPPEIPTPSTAAPSCAHDRLLAAAAKVFARDGIAGATTREIAREADVNEVTLFRIFKSKEGLLAAVIGQQFGDGAIARPEIPQPTNDLRHDLVALAETYDRLIDKNLPLVRTMIGEIQRHQEHEGQVFRGLFVPIKEAVLARMQSAHDAGELRPEMDPHIIADLFGSMVFMGVLRRNTPHLQRPYSSDDYLRHIVDLILAGATQRR